MPLQVTIGFKRLEVECLIGTFPHEKTAPQTIRITLAARLKTAPQDFLSATIDYTTLADICKKICRERHRDLIETLAQDILEGITQVFEIERIKITLEKPAALKDAKFAFVEVEQEMAVCAGR